MTPCSSLSDATTISSRSRITPNAVRPSVSLDSAFEPASMTARVAVAGHDGGQHGERAVGKARGTELDLRAVEIDAGAGPAFGHDEIAGVPDIGAVARGDAVDGQACGLDHRLGVGEPAIRFGELAASPDRSSGRRTGDRAPARSGVRERAPALATVRRNVRRLYRTR